MGVGLCNETMYNYQDWVFNDAVITETRKLIKDCIFKSVIIKLFK